MIFIIIGLLIIVIVLATDKEKDNSVQVELIKKQLVEESSAEITQKARDHAKETLDALEREIAYKTKYNEDLKRIREEELDILINEEKEQKMKLVDEQVTQYYNISLAAANSNLADITRQHEARKVELSQQIDELEVQLTEYKAKQDAINGEILRKRELEENETFYRVILDDDSITDIEILSQVRNRLIHPQNLDKLIYDLYISKPTTSMIKRVLQGKKPCGIYKITRLKTGEIYIGKSTDVSSRWQQHVKSAFHCGTISHSMLHTLMEKDGIQNFTFELVEEVEKDKLSEREKYYIDFYDTKSMGLNERKG